MPRVTPHRRESATIPPQPHRRRGCESRRRRCLHASAHAAYHHCRQPSTPPRLSKAPCARICRSASAATVSPPSAIDVQRRNSLSDPSASTHLSLTHTARAHLLPALPSQGRTFIARGIPADACNTAADVEVRTFTSQHAHARSRAQHDQHCFSDPGVHLYDRAPRRRYKHKQKARRSRHRGRCRSRHCRDAADVILQTPSAITPAPPSSPVPPTNTHSSQPRFAQAARKPLTQLHRQICSTRKFAAPLTSLDDSANRVPLRVLRLLRDPDAPRQRPRGRELRRRRRDRRGYCAHKRTALVKRRRALRRLLPGRRFPRFFDPSCSIRPAS
eukprot:6212877-Pleurochrysis_carterae.AAC.5